MAGLTTDSGTWQFWWNPVVKCVEEVIAAGSLWVEVGRGIFRTYSEKMRGKVHTKLNYGILPKEKSPRRNPPMETPPPQFGSFPCQQYTILH